MRIVIVEDSRLARAELRTLLSVAPDAEVVGEAGDVDTGVRSVDERQPDLLLLDIHLPGGSGFDLLDRVEHLPLVVFTTAFDRHAVDAFERSAVDYLVKPIERERLAAALQRVRERLATRPAATRKGESEMVFVRDGERCWFVRLADISGFESCGNYAQAWFKGQRPLIARTLAQLEERLDDTVFFRASRSHIVNLSWVQTIEPWVNDGYRITLRDGHVVDVSRRQGKVLRGRLEL